MLKWIGAIGIGVALGAGAVLLAQQAFENDPVPTPPVQDTPTRVSVPARTVTPGTEDVSLARIAELGSEFERAAALYDLLRSADAGAVEALLDEAAAINQPFASHILYSRYIELAPRAAVTHLLAHGNERRSLTTSALLSWAKRDLDDALAFVDTLDDPLRTQTAKNILNIVEGLSEARRDEIARQFSVESHVLAMRTTAEAATDPESAWQKAWSMEPGSVRDSTLRNIAHRWLNQDPAEALAAVASVADGHGRSRWQQQLLRRWHAVDPDAALQWAVSQPPSGARESLILHVAGLAAADSPRETLEFAQTLDPKVRREVARRVLQVWATTDAAAAIEALEDTADPRLTRMVQGRLIRSWAESDPMAAFEWALATPVSRSRSEMLATTLVQVVQSDPTEAATLASELDSSARSQALDRVLVNWVRDDPRAAAAWLDGSPYKTPSAVRAVVRGYTRLDAEEAFDWLQAQSVEAQRQSVSTIIDHVAQNSPEAAFRLIRRLDDPGARGSASTRLIHRWVDQDPRAALRAITRMDNASAPQLYSAAFQRWAGFDFDSATAFLNRVPSSGRDGAILGVMQQALYQGEAAVAERMYERLDGEAARQRGATTMSFWLSRIDHPRAAHYREVADSEG